MTPWSLGARSAATLAAVGTLAACGAPVSDGITPFTAQGGVVVVDFDGDGRADVAVASTRIAGPPPHAGAVDVYLQTGAGALAAPVSYAVGPDPWGLAAGDIDGDGRLDLVATTPHATPIQEGVVSDSGGVAILRQALATPGRFVASQWRATGGMAEAAAIAELSGDSAADLVVADAVGVNGRALLFVQDPARVATFGSPSSLLVGSGRGSVDVAAADVNGDGLVDVVLAASNAVVVLYRLGSGGFAPAVVLTAGVSIVGVGVADLDGDGRADIVAVDAGNSPAGGTGGARAIVLLQTSPGVFAETRLVLADGAHRAAIGDLNGDGVPDLAVVSLVTQNLTLPSRVTVLLQSVTSRGVFASAGVYSGTMSSNFLALGDMNGDGLIDIVLNEGPSVLLQRSAAPGSFDAVRPLR